MWLRKRKCDVAMRLVPYGAGWTDVYLTIGGDEHYFIISNVVGDQFSDLLSILYRFHPDHRSEETTWDCIEYKVACAENGISGPSKIADSTKEAKNYQAFDLVPWKAHFSWDEEGSKSVWELERDPTEERDFTLRITIDHKEKQYHYAVRYADFCYAVAKACTEALKKHGFGGYHQATYTQDMNVRELLFIKGIALGNLDACKLTPFRREGGGETSDFRKEMKLLLFDM